METCLIKISAKLTSLNFVVVSESTNLSFSASVDGYSPINSAEEGSG